jgi:hypothetical protein
MIPRQLMMIGRTTLYGSLDAANMVELMRKLTGRRPVIINPDPP